jgi:predicted 3-demethylubiquinone-9 3-methyltransferase (glyoxalase superfamily)
MTVEFELAGQRMIALNGGPHFKFTEAISLTVNCETQPEIDEFWDSLSAGGQPVQCGWLKDQFGLSWQIVPASLERMMMDPDPARCERVMQAVLQMKKLDIAALQRAYDGVPAPAGAGQP